MEFQDVVRRRRMVRSFLPDSLPRDTVERIVANAQRAPSAGFSQGWAFVVLEDEDDRRRFWASTFDDSTRRDTFRWQGLFAAPLLIVPLSHKQAYLDRYAEPDKGWEDRREDRWPVPYWDIDTGFAALLMLLTAVDAGVGALFFGIFPQAMPRFRAEFGVPEAYTPIGAIAIGRPAEDDEPSPSLRRGWRPADDVIHRGHW